MSELIKLADMHQYYSEPMPEEAKRGPVVRLLNATPDPLGSIAACCGIYKGKVIRSLSDVTDDERRAALDAMMSTELAGALEAAQLHFLIEGVGRDFTHQAVRGRHAFYAQESLRFAVKENWASEIPLPPYLSGTKGDQYPGAENSPAEYARNIWEEFMEHAEQAYLHLINIGMPAEEARKILPHAVTTRYHWITDLRELLHVAGLRTCTQAQFDWRLVMAQIAKALREYGAQFGNGLASGGAPEMGCDEWQFALIADKIRPVCYQTGRCGFMAEFDRSCTIRRRVELLGRMGVPPSEWGTTSYRHADFDRNESFELRIDDSEWLTNPGAARKAQ